MKRMVALFMTLILLASCTLVLAESQSFTPILLPLLEYSASDWTDNSTARAYLAVMALVEYNVAVDENMEIDYTKDIYISVNDGMLLISFCKEGGSYISVGYSPDAGMMYHDPAQSFGTSSSAMKSALEQTTTTTYIVSLSDLAEASEALASIFSDE
ncbi:MAG: hypothetical protein Q4B32_05730 [Clostridia bacterium]|nr:hypothetical protein [Clostridia bacterium]